MKLAPDARHILIPCAASFLMSLIGYQLADLRFFIYPALAALLLICFLIFFFRDPERNSPVDSSVILAPADGRIVAVDGFVPGEFSDYAFRLSIFLSLFDVHINRAPVNGVVKRCEYHPGRFFPAFWARAGAENEHTAIEFENQAGTVGLCQWAGFLARRIVCRLREGNVVMAGERFGLIRFGSRVDLFMPSHVRLRASCGERVKAGETVLAEFITHES